jgi:hypothetical protein
VATDYRLDGRGSIPGTGARPGSYPMGTRGLFAQGTKLPGHKANHSPPISAEVKIGGSILHSPYVFMAWCNFAVYFYCKIYFLSLYELNPNKTHRYD